jgi:multicomponent K+:H+ antiporter subunit F
MTTLTAPLLLWALKGALFLLALAMLCAVTRLLLGPAAQDRITALDCLYVNSMLTMLVLGILYASSVYFEAALLIALFGFVGSTALAKFLLRGEVIE